ncbi:microtubule-associated protein 70-2 [Trifolium repens]|nr:microtubule-associated protein 70-2 [Trifolium repens]
MNEYPVGISNKDRELSEAQAEIKGLRHSEQLREKVAEEFNHSSHCCILYGYYLTLKLLVHIYASTLRRVLAILAPLEAELKLAWIESIAKLQDDNKALDHLTKSKEAALIEAEKTVQVAFAFFGLCFRLF